ncbi:MAG: hypothetical protein MZV64_13285 [Ignavibacteriales bacterium]|nr:hypothetical protein [Ignavibacteriales bacterium]
MMRRAGQTARARRRGADEAPPWDDFGQIRNLRREISASQRSSLNCNRSALGIGLHRLPWSLSSLLPFIPIS